MTPITCSWCGNPVPPNAGRMRLHQSEGVRLSGKTLATFHPECGDALLDYCEEQTRAPVSTQALGPDRADAHRPGRLGMGIAGLRCHHEMIERRG